MNYSKPFAVALAALAVLFFVSCASALSVSAESSIPAGAQWSFSVDLGSLSAVDDARIFVDDELSLVIFEHMEVKYVADSPKSSKVMAYSLSANTITVSFAGLSAGSHTITVRSYKGAQIMEENSAVVSAVSPMSEAQQQALRDRLTTVESTAAAQKSTIDSLQSDLDSKNQQIESLQSENRDLQQTNDELFDAIKRLDENIALLEQDGTARAGILDTVKDDLNALLEEREAAKKSPLAGLFAFGSSSTGFFLILIAALAIIIGAVYYKTRGSSIYSTPLLQPKFNSKIKDEEISALDKSDGTGFLGKWGIGSKRQSAPKPAQEKPAYESKKVGPGDLVR